MFRVIRSLNDAFDAGCWAAKWWYINRLMLVKYDDERAAKGGNWCLFWVSGNFAKRSILYAEFVDSSCK